jgi:hypothetical protein
MGIRVTPDIDPDYERKGGAPKNLDTMMTYEDFIDALTDAWLEAEQREGVLVDPRLRRGIFYLMDRRVEAKDRR